MLPVYTAASKANYQKSKKLNSNLWYNRLPRKPQMTITGQLTKNMFILIVSTHV